MIVASILKFKSQIVSILSWHYISCSDIHLVIMFSSKFVINMIINIEIIVAI